MFVLQGTNAKENDPKSQNDEDNTYVVARIYLLKYFQYLLSENDQYDYTYRCYGERNCKGWTRKQTFHRDYYNYVDILAIIKAIQNVHS